MGTYMERVCHSCKTGPRRDPDSGAMCSETCKAYEDFCELWAEANMPEVLKVRQTMKGEK